MTARRIATLSLLAFILAAGPALAQSSTSANDGTTAATAGTKLKKTSTNGMSNCVDDNGSPVCPDQTGTTATTTARNAPPAKTPNGECKLINGVRVCK